MRARRYTNKEDRPIIALWAEKRAVNIQFQYDIPEFGLVVSDSGNPIAIGFLRHIEGNGAFLDSFITNPREGAVIRDKALDFLTDKLIEEAKDMGWRFLMAYTVEERIIERAIKHGLNKMTHTLLSMKLEGK